MYQNFNHLIGWQRNLEFFTNSYDLIILLLPAVLLAPLYFSGQIQLGVIPQASSLFGVVLGALSIIVKQFEQLSAFQPSYMQNRCTAAYHGLFAWFTRDRRLDISKNYQSLSNIGF